MALAVWGHVRRSSSQASSIQQATHSLSLFNDIDDVDVDVDVLIYHLFNQKM